MSVAVPVSTPEPPPPAGPRLEFRVAGRTATYPLTREAFTVGSGMGCDVRIPGKQVPAAFGRVERTPDGFLLRPLSPTHPILVNGQPLSGDRPVLLASGDRLTFGPADATFHVASPPVVVRPKLFVPIDPPQVEPTYLRPKFIREEVATGWDAVRPGDFVPETGRTVPDAVESVAEPNPINLDGLHAQLLARSRELDERAAELEADRVLWYRRRQEMEDELRALPRDERVRAREADLATKELDLARARDELGTLRQSLYDQYRERRDQLSEMQDAVRAQAAAVAERERVVAERERTAEARWQEAGRLHAAAEAYERDLAELAERQTQLDAAFAELERQKLAVAETREELARGRHAFEEERTLHDAQWRERDGLLATKDADLARREDELRHRLTTLADERTKAVNAIAAYDEKTAELTARVADLDRRAADIDARHAQLVRDAADLEDQLTLADESARRTHDESLRLDGLREGLERREAEVASRSAACESQVAALAVLRAALDRRQAELADVEAQAAATRHTLAAAQEEMDRRLADAARLRDEIGHAREDAEADRQTAAERAALAQAERDELRRRDDALKAVSDRLAAKEAELNDRTADLAEQAATLKARVQQVMDVQERLEADRRAVRERATHVGESEAARLGLQEQLRRRAEELSAKARLLDATAARVSEERAAIDQVREELAADRHRLTSMAEAQRREADEHVGELERRVAAVAHREAALTRQVARLREAGQTVAAERKSLFEAKQNWERDRAAALADEEGRKLRLGQFEREVVSSVDELRRHAPELEERARGALAQLAAAKESLRGQLEELRRFAQSGRAELERERERLRERDRALENARDEHRHAVSSFRQELHDWQASLADLREAVGRGESVIDGKRADLDDYARKAEEQARDLDRRERELHEARRAVAVERGELDRHLGDMRDWYKRKLRELAGHTPPGPRVAEGARDEDLSPGDRQLGELLRRSDLVDTDTLDMLWAEAARQRRSLRQVLLASGTLTLFQLALIEAGNLDGLVSGRFRLVDRLRSSPRESVYKVFDPERASEANRGTVVLRMLGDQERHDAVRPDEYRQRFATLLRAHHPNLGNTLEVLDLAGRPGAVQEFVGGLASVDWPTLSPGVWLKLLTDTASAVAALHRLGLAHGRLDGDAVRLTPLGFVKVVDGGLPEWLDGGPLPDGAPALDLKALADVAEQWAAKADGRKGKKPKPLPDPLRAVLRRLAAGGDYPMADEVAKAEAYPDADHLLVDLHRLASAYPCPSADWAKLLDAVASVSDTSRPSALRLAG
jgi:chromosome segregation ATPase